MCHSSKDVFMLGVRKMICIFLTETLFLAVSILQICIRIQKPVSEFYQMSSRNGRWGNFSTCFASGHAHVDFPLILGIFCTVPPNIQRKSGVDSFSSVNMLIRHLSYIFFFLFHCILTTYVYLSLIGAGCDNP